MSASLQKSHNIYRCLFLKLLARVFTVLMREFMLSAWLLFTPGITALRMPHRCLRKVFAGCSAMGMVTASEIMADIEN